MNDFLAFMETVTVLRMVEMVDDSGRPAISLAASIEIAGIIRPLNDRKGGDTRMLSTRNQGRYTIGSIVLITEAELKDASTGVPDRILYQNIQYEVLATQRSTIVMPHFRYICDRKI
jgi:hypothetical protein